MRWPSWLSKSSTSAKADTSEEAVVPAQTSDLSKPPVSSSNASNNNAWSHFVSLNVVVPSLVLTVATLGFLRFYKTYLRRIPNTSHIKPELYRRRSLFGYVTSVGDGDNFRLFHTPGGRLAGWGWLPWRRVKGMKRLQNKTIHIRLAGVDAPECAHFGRPAQPYSAEALSWLRSYIENRYVRAYIHRRDQYDRVVATVLVRRWLLFRRDVSLEMLDRGLATVYEAKFGSEFGDKEQAYRDAEARAKKAKIGMWAEPGLIGRILGEKKQELESPRAYKTRMAAKETKGNK
ncbi:putative endonuclease lcl3 [Elasticomyces elasticus]|nr:putative endonuclease lcl3 [Elasticomyces elasticus]